MVTNVRDTASYELADVGQRFAALIIDNILLGIIGAVLFGATRSGGMSGLSTFAVGVVYNWYFWTRNGGQTPGKMLMNIRVIKADGTPIQDGDAVVRYIGYYINSFLFMLGWLWAFADSKHQGWHDKIANTYVVRADSAKPKRKNEYI